MVWKERVFCTPTTLYFEHSGYHIDHCPAISQRECSLLIFNTHGQAIPFLFLFFLNIYLAAPGLSCTTQHL